MAITVFKPDNSFTGSKFGSFVSVCIKPALGVSLATFGIYLAEPFDKEQASLLYLPVVMICAIRLGFFPAIFCAILSFLCWDWFFLPPVHTFVVSNPKDFTSLIVFLIAAGITAKLASDSSLQAETAQNRLVEMQTLMDASDEVTYKADTSEVMQTLESQLRKLCNTDRMLIFKCVDDENHIQLVNEFHSNTDSPEITLPVLEKMAHAVIENDQSIGIGEDTGLWAKALSESLHLEKPLDPKSLGVFIPMHASGKLVGVLHVGPSHDGKPFTELQQRLIQTLANHAAVVIARESISAQAAQLAALKEADNLKDALLSLVSHELRTPLSAIKAFSSGLIQENSSWDDESARQALKSIDSETDRLTTLIDNLLDLSRLDSGNWKPNRDWCDMRDVIDTALLHLNSIEADRIKVSIADDVPIIRIDHAQISLVIQNLLQNSLKYSLPNTPIELSVTLELNYVDEEPKGVIVRIRDYGNGILTDETEKLFTPFFRSRQHRNSLIHGTGIGLALCKALVDAHGGFIEASNATKSKSRGAIFTFHLPIDRTEAE